MLPVILRSFHDLNTDGKTGLPENVTEQRFATVTEAISAGIREQAQGWLACQEIEAGGHRYFPRGSVAADWARDWDEGQRR